MAYANCLKLPFRAPFLQLAPISVNPYIMCISTGLRLRPSIQVHSSPKTSQLAKIWWSFRREAQVPARARSRKTSSALHQGPLYGSAHMFASL